MELYLGVAFLAMFVSVIVLLILKKCFCKMTVITEGKTTNFKMLVLFLYISLLIFLGKVHCEPISYVCYFMQHMRNLKYTPPSSKNFIQAKMGILNDILSTNP